MHFKKPVSIVFTVLASDVNGLNVDSALLANVTKTFKSFITLHNCWVVVAVKWSTCSPSISSIRIRIRLTNSVNCLNRTEINKKMPELTYF